jgi:chromosome segregation ATPase
MIRFATGFNFIGVLALAVLCAAQWRIDSQLHSQITDLEAIRIQQIEKITEQEKTIRGQSADLDDFRNRLMLCESQLNQSQEMVGHLKAALDKWIAAVDARDKAIKQAGVLLQKLADERNDAVMKFNDLASKYNTLVKDWNSEHGGQNP